METLHIDLSPADAAQWRAWAAQFRQPNAAALLATLAAVGRAYPVESAALLGAWLALAGAQPAKQD